MLPELQRAISNTAALAYSAFGALPLPIRETEHLSSGDPAHLLLSPILIISMEGSQASRSYDTTLDFFYFRPPFPGLVYESGNSFSILFATSCAVLQVRLEVHLSIKSVILIYYFNVNFHITLAGGTCTVDKYI